jgi:hypothetical protein
MRHVAATPGVRFNPELLQVQTSILRRSLVKKIVDFAGVTELGSTFIRLNATRPKYVSVTWLGWRIVHLHAPR